MIIHSLFLSSGHPILLVSVQFSSVAQLCLTLCYHMDCSTPGLPVYHNSWSLLKLMSIESVMPSNHLILCHPLLILPSVFPSIRVFSNESVLCIRWPKYWSFSLSISPSNQYSGLISFRVDWLDLLAVQGILLAFVFLSKNKFKVTELLFITRKFLHLSQCFPKKQTNRRYIYIHNSLCK